MPSLDYSFLQKLQDDIANLNIENRQLESVKKIIDKEFSAWIISNGIDFIKAEMNKLSLEVFGSSSRWQKIVNNGVSEPHERDQEVMVPVNGKITKQIGWQNKLP